MRVCVRCAVLTRRGYDPIAIWQQANPDWKGDELHERFEVAGVLNGDTLCDFHMNESLDRIADREATMREDAR